MKVLCSPAIALNPKPRPRAKASLKARITSTTINKRRKIITETNTITGRNRKNKVALGVIRRVRLYFLHRVVMPRATSLLTVEI